MPKLFKQKFKTEEEDTFFIVADSKKHAEDLFLDSSKEILESLTEDEIPSEVSDIEEVADLSDKEAWLLKGVIWGEEGIKNEIKKEFGLKRLKEVV